MAWLDNLLNHFALYPAHLFALLFVMALSKSTQSGGIESRFYPVPL